MVLSLRESDDEFSPEDIEALMKINRSLMKINETLDRMEASSRKHSDDFERRMRNLEKKLGYTWSPQPTPMEPPKTADPVKPVIYPHEPSKENALNEDVAMDVDDERATEKSQSDMSNLEYLKLNTTHSVDAGLNLKVSHTNSILKTSHVDVVNRGARASSYVRYRNSSLCTPCVCENDSKTYYIYLDKNWHIVESISKDVHLRWLSLQKPPWWPPDATRNSTISLELPTEFRKVVLRYVKSFEEATVIKIQDFNYHLNDNTSVCGVLDVCVDGEVARYISYIRTFVLSEFVTAQACKNTEDCTCLGYYTVMKYIYLESEKSVWWSPNQNQSSSMWTYDILLHFYFSGYIKMITFKLEECRCVIHPYRFSKKYKHKVTSIDFVVAAMAITIEESHGGTKDIAVMEQLSELKSKVDTHSTTDCVAFSPLNNWYEKTSVFPPIIPDAILFETLQVFGIGNHMLMLVRLGGYSVVLCPKDFIPMSRTKGILSVLWLVHVCAQMPNITNAKERTEGMTVNLMQFEKQADEFSISEGVLLRDVHNTKITNSQEGNSVAHYNFLGKWFEAQWKGYYMFQFTRGKEANVITIGNFCLSPCQMIFLIMCISSTWDYELYYQHLALMKAITYGVKVLEMLVSFLMNIDETHLGRHCLVVHMEEQVDCASGILCALLMICEGNCATWYRTTHRERMEMKTIIRKLKTRRQEGEVADSIDYSAGLHCQGHSDG